MTPSDRARLVEFARGFRGRFFFDEERGDVAFIAKDCEDRQCDCEVKTTSDGDQDCSVSLYDIDDVGELVASVLSALPELLAENEAKDAAMELMLYALVNARTKLIASDGYDDGSALRLVQDAIDSADKALTGRVADDEDAVRARAISKDLSNV